MLLNLKNVHYHLLALEAAAFVSCIGRALYWLAAGTSYSGCFVAFLPGDHGKLHRLSVADRTHSLAWVIAGDRSLVNEHILLCVIPMDNTCCLLQIISTIDCKNYFLFYLFKSVISYLSWERNGNLKISTY